MDGDFGVSTSHCIFSEKDHFKNPTSRKGQSEGTKRLEKRPFLRGRQIAYMIYDYFRVTGAHDTLLLFDTRMGQSFEIDESHSYDDVSQSSVRITNMWSDNS